MKMMINDIHNEIIINILSLYNELQHQIKFISRSKTPSKSFIWSAVLNIINNDDILQVLGHTRLYHLMCAMHLQAQNQLHICSYTSLFSVVFNHEFIVGSLILLTLCNLLCLVLMKLFFLRGKKNSHIK